jgi:acyl-CoA hydrolase
MTFPLISPERLVGIEKALGSLKSDQVVVASMAAAEPTLFFKHLHKAAQGLRGVNIYCANPEESYECFSDDALAGRLAFRVMFLTSHIRAWQGRGIVHYVPQHLSQWTKNLLTNQKIDIFWGSCSVPDSRGFVSLGVGACYEPEVIRRAKTVILEINERMPVTYGATTFPIQKVDFFIENHHELPTLPMEKPDEVDYKIADIVSQVVPDGATMQLGIGALPNAVSKILQKRKGLGIHTELINNAIMELTKAGSVTNENKTIWPHKTVGAFVYGSQELYDFVHMNPTIELQPASVVNDPHRIGRNYRMTSVNSAVEIDITGQVCSESIGHQELSGVGGASDTHVGAQRSEGGRGIIALRSTTGKGLSKIVFELKPGAKVSISRNDVDTVVTEYGVAELKGKTVSERAQALASIAHPNFREELMVKAKSMGYI